MTLLVARGNSVGLSGGYFVATPATIVSKIYIYVFVTGLGAFGAALFGAVRFGAVLFGASFIGAYRGC